MKQKLEHDIVVNSEGMIQGSVTYGDRNFWYECDMGSQELVELGGNPEEFNHIASACLCEALGEQHESWTDKTQSCEGIWTTDLETHVLIAGMCLTVLLRNDIQ